MTQPLTTAAAATLAGLTPASFRREMNRARAAGVDCRLPADQWPDQRTPLWDGDQLRPWLASRPGRGNWKREETP